MTQLPGMFKTATAAYLDPGTGTMIMSAIVGIFATVALALKTYWYKFVGLFKGKADAPAGDETSADADSGPDTSK